jgi:hypothetical protein
MCWGAMAVLPSIGAIPFSEDVATARQWNYFGSTIPFWAIQIWWAVSGLLTIGGLVGMLRFWPTSRWMLAIALFGGFAMQPLLGLAVYSPLEASLAGIASASILWLVCVSFYSSLGTRFARSNSGSI